MSILERGVEQEVFLSILADKLLLDEKAQNLSSIAILRHVEAVVTSMIVELEFPEQPGSRFGSATANTAVVSALKEIHKFSLTIEEAMVLKKRLLQILVENSVAEHEREYLLSRARQARSR